MSDQIERSEQPEKLVSIQEKEQAKEEPFYCPICYEEFASVDKCLLKDKNLENETSDVENYMISKEPKLFKLEACDHIFCLRCYKDSFHSLI